MDTDTQRDRARRFRELHAGGKILVLANGWDVASAKLFEIAGFPAIGTTSAGVAWAHGYPDGQKIPFRFVVEMARRVAESVAVPVTADIEQGFGDGADEIARSIEQIIAAGAVGVNIEDKSRDPKTPLLDPPEMAAKIRAARSAADRAGIPLFVNARTDVYFLGIEDRATRVRETRERFRAYQDAGADGLFAPGLAAPDEISEILEAIRLPLNVYAIPGLPPAAELERLGVARVSVGCGPMQAALAFVRRIATDLKESGDWGGFTKDWMSPGELNALFRARG